MVRTATDDKYFEWLTKLVRPEFNGKSYYLLVRCLYEKEFFSLVPFDENRAEQGIGLRAEASNETGIDFVNKLSFGPCTVLEMMVVLAENMAYIMEGFEPFKNGNDWFWELVFNLGLEDYDDSRFLIGEAEPDVEEILERFLERRYEPDGTGGLFPLYDPKEDQRELDIYTQMHAYLQQSYPQMFDW